MRCAGGAARVFLASAWCILNTPNFLPPGAAGSYDRDIALLSRGLASHSAVWPIVDAHTPLLNTETVGWPQCSGAGSRSGPHIAALPGNYLHNVAGWHHVSYSDVLVTNHCLNHVI